MDESTEYKGYRIELCVDGTYDVTMPLGALVACDFKTIDEAKKHINDA